MPHSSNFNTPLTPQELVDELHALACETYAIVYSQRKGSPLIYRLLWESFPTMHATTHLLSHRKQKDFHLLQQNRVFHKDIRLVLKMYFLLPKHVLNLQVAEREDSPQQQAPPVTLPTTTITTTTTATTNSTTSTSPTRPRTTYPLTQHDPPLLQSPPSTLPTP